MFPKPTDYVKVLGRTRRDGSAEAARIRAENLAATG